MAAAATETVLWELDTHGDTSGQPLAWGRVHSLMRCLGNFCHLELYCWLDRSTNKRYKLWVRHLGCLADYVAEGNRLETHDDVLEWIRQQLYAKDQQYSEARNRASRGKGQLIHITNALPNPYASGLNVSSGPSTPSPPRLGWTIGSTNLDIPDPWDDAMQRYANWLGSKINREDVTVWKA